MTAGIKTPEGVKVAPTIKHKRRALLQSMGGVAAVAIGAAVVRTDAVAQTASSKSSTETLTDASQESGYRLTEHIRAYYRTTRL